MAELLIKAVDASHEDPTKDARGCYKRGDVVVVMPDGHQWGRMEGLPNFVVVKIPGVSHKRILGYIQPDVTVDAATGEVLEVVRRRKFRIRVNDVPNAIKDQLRTTGSVTVTWTQIRNFIRNKVTNLDETSVPEPV